MKLRSDRLALDIYLNGVVLCDPIISLERSDSGVHDEQQQLA
jgi:hypothetical protein